MTDLQKLYARERMENRRGHRAAIAAVARATALDEGTIQRCLRRAERADERDAKKAA